MSVEKVSNTTTVRETLDSTPSTKKKKKTFTIQFFSNPQNDEDEGKTFLGQKKVTTNRQGNASFVFKTDRSFNTGDWITATATGPGGSTSEFSDPQVVESL